MRKLDHLVALFENALAFVLVVGVLSVVAMQIVFRYFLSRPLSWSEELATYILVWLAFLGLAIAQRDNSHIAMQIFPKINEAPFGRWAAWGGMVLLFFLLGYGGFALARVNGDQHSPAMSLPMWAVYMILPLSSLLGLYHCARAIPALLRPPVPPQPWTGTDFDSSDASVAGVISKH